MGLGREQDGQLVTKSWGMRVLPGMHSGFVKIYWCPTLPNGNAQIINLPQNHDLSQALESKKGLLHIKKMQTNALTPEYVKQN